MDFWYIIILDGHQVIIKCKKTRKKRVDLIRVRISKSTHAPLLKTVSFFNFF